AEDGIRDLIVTGVQTCALPISLSDPDDAAAVRATIPRCRPEPSRNFALLLEIVLGVVIYLAEFRNNCLLLEPLDILLQRAGDGRSEERRVGKECRSRWGAE